MGVGCINMIVFLLGVVLLVKNVSGGAVAGPTFSTTPQYLRVRLGTDVQFKCGVANLPEGHKIGWTPGRTGQMVIFGDQVWISRYSYSEDGGDSVLHIRNVTLSDEDDYICGIPQSSMSQRSNLTIIIDASVVMTPAQSEKTFKLRQQLYLQCDARGRPEPTIEWMKDGKVLEGNMTSDGELLILHLGRRDGGVYQCVASNGVGAPAIKQINVVVEFAPQVSVKDDIIVTAIGKKLELNCIVSASPHGNFKWLKNQTDVDLRGKKSAVMEQSHHERLATLVIERVTEEDLGLYSCVATSRLGSANATMEVTVLPQRLKITSSPQGNYSNTYKLRWQVLTKETPIEYELLFRQPNLPNKTEEWANSTLPVKDARIIHGIHKQSYDIPGLTANNTYYIRLRARNMAGYSDWTGQFAFSTSKVLPTDPDDKGGVSIAAPILPSVVTFVISLLLTIRV